MVYAKAYSCADLKEDVVNLIEIGDPVCEDGNRRVIGMLEVSPSVPQTPQASSRPVFILTIISLG